MLARAKKRLDELNPFKPVTNPLKTDFSTKGAQAYAVINGDEIKDEENQRRDFIPKTRPGVIDYVFLNVFNTVGYLSNQAWKGYEAIKKNDKVFPFVRRVAAAAMLVLVTAPLALLNEIVNDLVRPGLVAIASVVSIPFYGLVELFKKGVDLTSGLFGKKPQPVVITPVPGSNASLAAVDPNMAPAKAEKDAEKQAVVEEKKEWTGMFGYYTPRIFGGGYAVAKAAEAQKTAQAPAQAPASPRKG